MAAKKRASTAILAIYQTNREKLDAELSKSTQDKIVSNNIQAYRHILCQLEQVYDIPTVFHASNLRHFG